MKEGSGEERSRAFRYPCCMKDKLLMVARACSSTPTLTSYCRSSTAHLINLRRPHFRLFVAPRGGVTSENIRMRNLVDLPIATHSSTVWEVEAALGRVTAHSLPTPHEFCVMKKRLCRVARPRLSSSSVAPLVSASNR